MGALVNGIWQSGPAATLGKGGKFERQDAALRNWITVDGSAGPSGRGGFKAEPGRYHLYVSLACPWAHRTLIFRVLKKLDGVITVSVVHYHMGENGWTFRAEEGGTGDELFGFEYLHQIYTKNDLAYSGKVTVPVLWDKETGSIVSNESSEIIRMLNSAFDEWGDASLDFYPSDLRDEIDEVNALVYPNINNGVYRAGFAKSQEAYNEAFIDLFGALDRIEAKLSGQRYLVGRQITEADWRLFTTLARFDPVYVGHFKCNKRRIADYPNLSNYFRDLFAVPGVARTVDVEHAKKHYYSSHTDINPTGIVPLGPELDYEAPHDRARFLA